MSKKVYLTEQDTIDGVLLHEIIENFQNEQVPRMHRNYELYKGKHAILDKKETDPNKPNNRLVNNYYGEIVDTITGYFLGNPIVLNYEVEEVQDFLDYIFADNDSDDLFMEIGKEGAIKGRSALMVYQNEYSETRMVRVPAEEVIFIYNANKPDELLYAVRFYKIKLANNEDELRYAEVYSSSDISYWIEDSEMGLFRVDDMNPPHEHIFGRVPIIEFPNNEERMGDFEKVISLVEDFDKIMSSNSDELEVFRSAYLMIKNMSLNNDTVRRLKEEGIIEVGEDGDVKFITKQLPKDYMTAHLDRLQDNIYRFSQVPNLSDDNFANNLSGVAIRFKLFGLETRCITKERKFRRAMKELIKVLAEPIRVITGEVVDLNKLSIQFTRNVPNNLSELADVIQKLNGIVDRVSLVGLLPFVDDAKDVVEMAEKEKDPYARETESFRQPATLEDFPVEGD